MSKTIKVRKDPKTNEVYLKLSDFKSLGYKIKDIKSYTLEPIDDDGKLALVLKFYDDNKNLITPEGK